VSPQGYSKYLKNQNKPYKYASLLADIQAILEEDEFNENYGKQRMYEKLQLDYECKYCYNTVAKVMRDNGFLHSPNKPKGITKADKMAQKSDNLLNRDFGADTPLNKAVTDITEWQASDGKVYSSAIFDCFDNVCLGLSIASNMESELVVNTVFQAAIRYDLTGLICHSDRGSQYTSHDFRGTLRDSGLIQSMNSAGGRCHDNAKCESMWARGKSEIMACYDTKKMTCNQLTNLIMRYYSDYWNYRRICSAIGGVPPMIKRGAYFLELQETCRA
jgi:transposase InsO family protein